MLIRKSWYSAKLFLLSISFVISFTTVGALSQTNQPNKHEDEKTDKTIIKAYYFHTAYRCPSCIKIEKWSHEAIQDRFIEEIKTGKIVWEAVDVDKAENKHFIKDYQLYTKSLVLVQIKNRKPQKWINLQKVWELLRDQQAFFEYVEREVNQFMEKK